MESPRKRLKVDMAGFDGPTDSQEPEAAAMTKESIKDGDAVHQTNDDQAAVAQALKETEVGITELVNPNLSAFSGILKKRYTDFLVNEILPSGEVLHLRNLKVEKPNNPKEKASTNSSEANGDRTNIDDFVTEKPAIGGVENETSDSMKTEEAAEENIGSAKSKFDPSREDEELLKSYIGEKCALEVIELHRRIIRSPNAKPRDLGNVICHGLTDRQVRAKIHEALRRIFSSRLESFTNSDGAMDISAAPPRARGNNRDRGGRGRAPNQQGNGRLGWADLGGDYLHFTLYKENKDTMEVIAYLSRQLKCNPRMFQFAGTKDRRGVTVQRASAYRIYADRMAGVGRTLRNAYVGDFKYEPQKLSLGDSSGNEFVITLRDCSLPNGSSSHEEISAVARSSMESFCQGGFINYYGLQRFGTFATRTDAVGVHMLKGNFKAACDAVLYYDPENISLQTEEGAKTDRNVLDSRSRADAIQNFRQTGDAQAALKKMPRKFSVEANIIQHLSRPGNGNDFLGALQTIPRNHRLMYVHAYQSLVWNFAASHRWKLFADKVVEGDLVMIGGPKAEVVDTDEVDADGEVVIRPDEEDSSVSKQHMFPQARPLTAEEASSGEYNIFDIVLPQPGFDVKYPANQMTDFYKEFMASERGGGLDPFDMRRKWRDISLPGGYRKLLGSAGGDCSAEVKKYARDDEQFVQTDVDILNDKNTSDKGVNNETPLPEDVSETKTAVILKFQLGSSQYATMALRELMKGGATAYKHDFGASK